MENAQRIETIVSGATQIFSEEGLRQRLHSGKTLKIKLGADPSRPDLHLGHSVVLRKLKLFQELGHEIIFVIGDFTGMIGDPTGKSKTRPALTLEETRKSGESYFKQVTKILDQNSTKILYNSSWLEKMNFSDVISLSSKYTVARIMERDDFSARFHANQPIGMHELLYPLVQGYDSVAIKADIEVGGTDQTFNLLVGRALQNDYGQAPQEVITYPLLVGLDGREKMSKSLDNYIGIDEPPEIMFEKAMRVPDELLTDYFILTTDTSAQKAAKLIEKDIREAHFEYARIIAGAYHGEAAVIEAENRYRAVAGGGIPQEVPVLEVPESRANICDLIKLAGFATSKSEARRNISGKGIKINGVTVEDIELSVDLKTPVMIQFGKNRFIKIKRRETNA